MRDIVARHTHTHKGRLKRADCILILHEAAVGDFIVMSPALRELRRLYPTAHITLIVEQASANLAECCPYVDEVIAAPYSSIPSELTSIYAVNLNLASELLKRRYDIAIAYAYSFIPNVPLLAYMSGANHRISHQAGLWEPLVTDFVSPINGKYQAVDVTLKYIEHLIKKPIQKRELEIWVADSDIETAQKILPPSTKLYAIGLGGAKSKKHYPPECYAELINMLRRADAELKFVLLGGVTDIEEAKILMSNVDVDYIVDLTGKTTFRETAAVLNFCNLYIGNDSAAMHLAAATNTPVLSPFCFASEFRTYPTVVSHWYPYGVPSVLVCPSHALPECRGSKNFYGCRAEYPHCIKQIAPQHLLDAYKILLERIAQGNSEPFVFTAE